MNVVWRKLICCYPSRARRFPSFRSLLLPLPLTIAAIDGAQDVPTDDPLPECPTCRIVVDTVVTLYDPTSQLQPHPYISSSLVQDADGRYYAAPLSDRRYIGVYKPDGRAVRSIGGSGIEPGQFLYVSEVKLRNDTLIGVDRGNHELDLIPLHEGEPTTIPLGYGPEGVLPLPNGGFVTQLNLASPATMGMPIHIHNNNGEHIRTFGRSSSRISSYAPYDLKRNIALGGAGSILVTWVNRYQIERWTESGTLVEVYRQKRSWFSPWSDLSGNARAVAPNTSFESIRLDEATGLVWCVFHVADSNWAPEPGVTSERHQVVPRLAERWRFYDTIIEVLDLERGLLISSGRFDEYVSGRLNSGRNLYSIRTEDAKGQQQMHVLSLEIVGWPRGLPE